MVPPTPVPAQLPGVSANYERILAGYRHHDFPDLSSRRFAPDQPLSFSLPLDQNQTALTNGAASYPLLVAAVARVVGTYSACQDVLLALADEDKEEILPVRVVWEDGQSWQEAAAGVADALADPHWPRAHPDLLRSTLDLAQKQAPALALIGSGAPLHRHLAPHFPLAVHIDYPPSSLSVTASERLCHPSQCKLFLSQVLALLAHASANPTSPISSLLKLPSALVSAYQRQSFEKRQQTYYLVPPTKYATDHVTLRATENPNGLAVRWYADLSTDVPISSFTPEVITNEQLDKSANQLGRWLLQTGLQKGRSVAVCMKRDVLFHVVFIGILRAGGCYVPIDAELPLERQQYIARDSTAQFILSTSDMPCFAALGDIAIDMKEPAIQSTIGEQSADPLIIPGLDDPSYILYTSGTTGTPKGCILTHRGLAEAIWALSQFCASAELAPPGRINYLSVASVAFDVHIAEIMVALAVGIPILAAPRSLLLEDLPYYIKHLRVSHVGIVPSLIEATMGAVQADDESGAATTLRYIASGGEKMSDAILDKWANHAKVRLANFYGPSEVTIGCAARMMDKDTPRANIGHTFANVSAYVVDEDMNIVLRGGTGELVVEGPLVGLGYVGRPDLTQKVFLKFPDDGTDRWAYRTGDLVRMMPDATLEIIGRIDTQIKLRGVRIESEGISSILRDAATPSHSLDVMTILAKHPAIGADQLVSFVAWDPSVPVAKRKGGKPTLIPPPGGLLQRLRAASERELASYMRPSHIIPLDFIPLSSNGKADAKVLTALFLSLEMEVLAGLMTGAKGSSTPEGVHREPTDLERKIYAMLEPYTKLPVGRLTPSTNLFECGMDSLAVARFAADLRKAFNLKVSPAQIMQAPVVSGVAALLEDDAARPVAHDSNPIVQQFAAIVRGEVEDAYTPECIADILPPLPVQEGVLYRSANAPTMYVQHVLLRLGSDLLVSGIRDAWREVVGRHEMLRTVFHFGTDLAQIVLRHDTSTVLTPAKEIVEQDDASFRNYFTEREAGSLARELNIDISKVPPVRLSFYTTDTSRTTFMVLSIHHALYDGISLPVLLQDLEHAYKHQPQIPSASFHDVLEYLAVVDQTAAQTFWSSYLKDFPWRTLLNRTASSSNADITSRTFTHSLSEMQSKASTQHVTLQALLMCAYGSLLAQHLYNHYDVIYGVIRAGRSIPVDHIETTICPMITVVPARVRLSDPLTALQTVQEDIARVSEYEHVPLSRLQKWVSDWDGSLFDTLFSVSFKDKETSELWTVLESQNPEPDYILAVEVVLDPEQDKAVVHAAYTSADISLTVVDTILSRLEEEAVRISESGDWGVALPGTIRPVPSSIPSSKGVSSEDSLDLVNVDLENVARICALAAQFLRIDQSFVKADTSLLSLGLDSIKSVGLSRKLSKEGFALSSADIMRLSTPLRFAAYIQRPASSHKAEDRIEEAQFAAECDSLAQALDLDAIKLTPEDTVKVFPTSVLQAGMLSQTLSSHGRLYVHLFPLRLNGRVVVDRLRKAWTTAIGMFDILRTSFHFLATQGLWVQAVHTAAPMQWVESPYDAKPNLAETLNPFLVATNEDEIFRRPPVFFHFLKGATADDSHRLVVVLHHALYDGLSIATLFHVVEQLYRGAEVAPLSQYHQLLPLLLWQEKNGTSFWVNNLRSLAHASIPRRLSEHEGPATVHQYSLPIHIAEQELQRACRDAEVTPQCVGQTAFAKLLVVLTGRRDVVFGRVVSGRDLPGADEVVGPMLNTVPCRVQFRDGLSNKSLLKEVHNRNIAGLAWQHASLRAIQRELGVSSLWDSLFVYQPRQESLESGVAAPWVFDAGDIDEINIHYPLNIELHEAEGGFIVKAACISDVASAEELRELVERYAAMLSDLVRGPQESWQFGLPDITESDGIAGDAVLKYEAEDDLPVDWETRFAAFREILSSTTKVNLSKVLPETYLAALGIDSITAVQIVARARRVGLRLTAAEVVQSRTVGDLLKKIQDVKAAAPTNAVTTTTIDVPRSLWSSLVSPPLIERVERITYASPGMEWMMGMWQRSKGSRFQHVFGYRVASDVDPIRLQRAWDELLRRHALLRSTFVYDVEAGAPRVVVFKADALASLWTSETVKDDHFAAVQQRMKDLVSHPPSINQPITRAVFLQSREARYLLIHLHHFQYDAWSLQLLVDDLTRLYTGEPLRSSNDLDSFLHFTSPSLETDMEQTKYWRAAISSSHTLFPSVCKNPTPGGRDVYTDHTAMPSAAKLDQRARELALPLQSVFLACWAQVQAKRSNTDVPVFSMWHSGRTGDLKDVERLAVPCINVLPFSVPGVQTKDALALARQIQDDLQARSAAVEQTRLARVHEWVDWGDEPLSNVFVNVVKIAPDLEKTRNGLFESLDVPYFIPNIPTIEAIAGVKNMHITDLVQDDIMIDIIVLQETDTVVMSIEFSEEVLDRALAKQMVEDWAALVRRTLSVGEQREALRCTCM